LRFGERLPNPFAEGEMTHWFHPLCAAFKRPEPILEALAEAGDGVPDRENLERIARRGIAHRRLPRIDGAGRAPSSQAKCRECRQPIERGAWRVRLVFYEEGQFSPAGFVHLDCREKYFATGDILEPVLHFGAELGGADRAELAHLLAQ
jgi:hypothetical protein